MKGLISLTFLLSLSVFGQSDSSLDTTCKKDGYSCGECEGKIQNDLNQLLAKITNGGFVSGDHWGDGKNASKNPESIAMDPSVTLDKTLQEIVEIFKKNNPDGQNKLNFIVIGESESTQETTIRDGKIYPRIMLKSPSSELMVTFNTDPEASGYNTLEIMRWNGKNGRYEFQEVNFGGKGKAPYVDVSGKKCLECHKSPDPRPNWDTYRAWAGVVPSRDDMMELHADNGEFDKKKGMQPDARAYLNFLDQVVADKESKTASRISLLDIPFDERVQMAKYVKDAKGKKFTPREQVELIKRQINKEGFYRIKHFPDVEENSEAETPFSMNFDQKTADLAGPSQFAFDQMLAQNMCKVATDLKKHPQFEKFKYAMALMMDCGQNDLSEILPEKFKKEIVAHYKKSNYAGFSDLDPSKRPKRDLSFEELVEVLREDTKANHDRADGFKFKRHERFLESYLTTVEKKSTEEAKEKAKFYSEEVVTPEQERFHAIDDAGGVKGVEEGSTAEIVQARLLLEPFGVNVSHWSLVHGKNNAYNSFSFSDQYELLETQPLWAEIREKAGSCEELEKIAVKALSGESVESPELLAEKPISRTDLFEANFCNDIMQNSLGIANGVLIKALEGVSSGGKKSLGKCLACHDKGGSIEFPGLANFLNGTDESEFIKYLGSKSEFYPLPMIEMMQIKLGNHDPSLDTTPYGEDMPPTPWGDNAEYAKEKSIPLSEAQAVRKKELGIYLRTLTLKDDRDKLKAFCESVNTDNYIKEFLAPVKDAMKNGTGRQ